MKRAMERLQRHPQAAQVVLLVVALLVLQAAPRSIGIGTYAVGAAAGAALALHALGVLLVFRANRFLNFAQIPIAGLASLVFVFLVQGRKLLDMLRSACGCVALEPGPLVLTVNFVLSVLLALGVAVLASYLVAQLVNRRFGRSPRIVCSLVTVFAGQVIGGLRSPLERFLLPKPAPTQTLDQVKESIGARSTRPPGDFEWRIDALGSYSGREMVLVLAAVGTVAALSWWLHRTRAGAELRAASERPARAETLGVDVAATATRAWLLAGLLAGVVGVATHFGLEARSIDEGQIAGLSVALVMLALVVGQMRHLWLIALAAVVFGVLQRGVVQGFQSTAPLEVALPLLVGVALLLQGQKPTRAELDSEAATALADENRPVPSELRHLPQVRTWGRVGGAVGAVVVLGLPWAMPGGMTNTATPFIVLVLVGLSLMILTGWAGQLSLGQMGIAAAGAWTAGASGLPAPFAILLGGIAGALVSALVGLPALRLRAVHVAIMTLAVALAARPLFTEKRYLGAHLPEVIDRPILLGMDFNDPRAFYYGAVAVALVACAAVMGLRRSRTGRVLIATRANPTAVTALGISVIRAKLTAFAVAGFLCGTAGAMLVYHQRTLSAETFSASASMSVFLYSVVGGLGGIIGPVLGFAFQASLSLFSSNPLILFAGTGLGGILLLAAAPGGIAQLLFTGRDAALRRLAIRQRIDVPSLLGRRQADRVPLREPRATTGARVVYDLPGQWAVDARTTEVMS